MKNGAELEENLKKGKIENCYVLCGTDEGIIKEAVEKIVETVVSKDFRDLNFTKFDGTKVNGEAIINACETLPFMSDKKVVLIYRANFLQDKREKEEKEDKSEKEEKNLYEEINKYLDKLSKQSILIMYYIFATDRDKPSNKIKKLEKNAYVVKLDKYKGAVLEKKVKELFDKKGKEIGKVALNLFCAGVENNMNMIHNEIDKIINYTEGREITKEDIDLLLPEKNDNDIFNLVDLIAQRKPEKAIDIVNALLFKGEKVFMILSMIQRQFKLLLYMKVGIEEGKNKEELASEFKLHPFVCEKVISQSRRFSLKQLIRGLELCVDSEKNMKSTSVNEKLEIELLIINTVRG